MITWENFFNILRDQVPVQSMSITNCKKTIVSLANKISFNKANILVLFYWLSRQWASSRFKSNWMYNLVSLSLEIKRICLNKLLFLLCLLDFFHGFANWRPSESCTWMESLVKLGLLWTQRRLWQNSRIFKKIIKGRSFYSWWLPVQVRLAVTYIFHKALHLFGLWLLSEILCSESLNRTLLSPLFLYLEIALILLIVWRMITWLLGLGC